ncbi:MAG: chemotaxis protein CheW [Sulfuricurvum sp.]|uniref:chemotaxis protein CheW n=1 Tax=Sulfuricurvum sp. TaxID=2025608 RepID=UPI002636783E|nr:chemotaxis protein CheW [Sulfuricurvum sp.]MDD2828697.1 chemotaxis protein CheW [Sulfuricurvum sp.]MDD4949275.1 chemotaxis protein CheW [Sulfuricurvum sp.]
MSDFIVFSVGNSQYAIEVDSVERIDQIGRLTPLANAHPYIEGVMNYQDYTLKVLSFRRLSETQTHEEQILQLFNQVIKDHQNWVQALELSLREGTPFALALDPHLCRLGKWIYTFSAHDPEVLAIIRAIIPVHAQLHEIGAELLKLGSNEEKLDRYNAEIVNGVYVETMKMLSEMVRRSNDISAQSQKLLIYRSSNGLFAIKVDGIKDIVSFDESQIKPYRHQVKVGEYLETRGVVEYNKSLVVVVSSIKLPNESVA